MTLPGGSGVTQHMGYDPSDRLVHLDLAGPMAFTWPLNSAYDYGYDPATSWTTAVTSTVNTFNGGQPVVQTLAHDAQGRLRTLGTSDGSWSAWGYDKNGNMTSAAITDTTGAVTTTAYGYDTHGDTVAITGTGAPAR